MNDKEWMNLFIIAIIGFCCFFGFLIEGTWRNSNNFGKYLEMNGFEVVGNIEIDSPSLIYKMDYEGFINIIENRTVFRVGSNFYVFNDGMTIAYRYFVGVYFGGIPWKNV